MAEVVLKLETRRAVKIALSLRRIEHLLQVLNEDQTFVNGPHYEEVCRSQEQLLWLARAFEGAVKAAAPELASHERPQVRHKKLVWCAGEGCTRALTLEQRRVSDRCPVCLEAKKEQ